MRHYTPGPVTSPPVHSLLLALLLLTAAGVPARPAAEEAAHPGGGNRVGPETCKACHPAAYETWRIGPHARSVDGLPPQSRKDQRCLSCHSPDADEGLSAVTCEACHGPGRIYSAPYVMRDPELARLVGMVEPGEKICLACHGESAPSLVKLEYAKKLPLVDHWTRERAARGTAPAAPAARGK
jgi:hypothetical protein